MAQQTKKHLVLVTLTSLLGSIALFLFSYLFFTFAMAWSLVVIMSDVLMHLIDSTQLYGAIVDIISIIQWVLLFVNIVLIFIFHFIKTKKAIWISMLSVVGLLSVSIIIHTIAAILLLYIPTGSVGLHGAKMIIMFVVAIAIVTLQAILFVRYLKSNKYNLIKQTDINSHDLTNVNHNYSKEEKIYETESSKNC